MHTKSPTQYLSLGNGTPSEGHSLEVAQRNLSPNLKAINRALVILMIGFFKIFVVPFIFLFREYQTSEIGLST